MGLNALPFGYHYLSGNQGVSLGFKIGRPKRFCGRGPIFSWGGRTKNMYLEALPQLFVVMEL